jgi:hypothetical protein
MAIVIALAIALVAVAFVAAPLFLRSEKSAGPGAGDDLTSDALQDLLAEKETIYGAIQELDFDLKSGKLSEADHRGLRQRYEERAAVVLKAIDDAQGAAGNPEMTRKARWERRRG